MRLKATTSAYRISTQHDKAVPDHAQQSLGSRPRLAVGSWIMAALQAAPIAAMLKAEQEQQQRFCVTQPTSKQPQQETAYPDISHYSMQHQSSVILTLFSPVYRGEMS